MAVPEGALKKDSEYVGLDIREITQKFANKAAIELLKHMALNMRKEHFKDARSFSYNKGLVHCLFRISNPSVEDILEIWKRVPKGTKKYWEQIMEAKFDQNGIVVQTDDKWINKEPNRYIW